MFKQKNYTFLLTIIMVSLLATACGAEATPASSIIETAVAETVAARDTAESAAATSTPTARCTGRIRL